MPKLDISALKLPFGAKLSKPAAALSIESDEQKKIEVQRLQIELLNIIIERYRKFIEDGETKSVSELRTLVKPLDAAVTEIKIQIEDQFHPYTYESNFLLATQRAMDITFSWKKIKMPLSFWMSFEDMVRLKCADDLDRAIILCSVFRALSSDSAMVLIGKDKSAWVSFVFGDKHYVVNISERTMSAYKPDSEGLKKFMYDMAYSFNDRDFNDFSEEK